MEENTTEQEEQQVQQEKSKKRKYVPSPEQIARYRENRKKKLANMSKEEKAAWNARLKETHDLRMQDPAKRARERDIKRNYVARRLAENPNWLKERWKEMSARKRVRMEFLEEHLKPGEKLCHQCGKVYKEEDFPITRTGERSVMCKTCYERMAGEYNIYSPKYWDKRATQINNRIKRRNKTLATPVEFTEITGKELFDLFHKQNMVCPYCGVELNALNESIDHIVSITKGGPHNMGNIQIICRSCNEAKFQMDDESFKKLLELVNSFKDFPATVQS